MNVVGREYRVERARAAKIDRIFEEKYVLLLGHRESGRAQSCDDGRTTAHAGNPPAFTLQQLSYCMSLCRP